MSLIGLELDMWLSYKVGSISVAKIVGVGPISAGVGVPKYFLEGRHKPLG